MYFTPDSQDFFNGVIQLKLFVSNELLVEIIRKTKLPILASRYITLKNIV